MTAVLVSLNAFEVLLLLCVVVAVGFALRRQSRQLNALLELVELLDEDSRRERKQEALRRRDVA